MRRIPGTRTLLAFEAAARHGSFTRAADELALTHSAICRQIAGLEEWLGVKLFARGKKGVTLSAAGLRYWRMVRIDLDRLEQNALDLMANHGLGGVLELAVLPSIASAWLIPRLADFQQRFPDITVNLGIRTRPFLFAEENFDAALHVGDPLWPGAVCDFLFPEECVPVCCPAVLERLRRDGIGTVTLLHLSSRPQGWSDWFDAAGIDRQQCNPMKGPRFELFSMLITAASHGLGIALVPRILVAAAVQAGDLVPASEQAIRFHQGYYLVYPDANRTNPSLTAFRDWLLVAAQAP